MKKEKSAQNSRSTFAVLFYLNTSKVKKSGKCPVMGRITVDGKEHRFQYRAGTTPGGMERKRVHSHGEHGGSQRGEQTDSPVPQRPDKALRHTA